MQGADSRGRDDTQSALDAADRWRLNLRVSLEEFEQLLGPGVHDPTRHPDVAATDTLFAHPLYASQGWVAVVNPADRTLMTVLDLLRSAHDRARVRASRRAGRHQDSPESEAGG